MKCRRSIVSILMLAPATGFSPPAVAQTIVNELPTFNEAWYEPFPPFRVVNNLYYVGTYDLASYLITTDEGHFLINTGSYRSVPMIRSSIEELGFEFGDVEILLTTQAHYDHTAGLAEIRRLTGARMMAHGGDVASLEDGGNSDFRYPEGRGTVFEPVEIDEALQDGGVIELGGTQLTLHHHPGHTKGASSFSFITEIDGESYSVLIVNMNTINNGVTLLDMPGYPEIVEDYADTFARQKALMPDIWVSSHAGHFDLHDKIEPGDPYDPTRFMGTEGYLDKIALYEGRYLQQLENERDAR